MYVLADRNFYMGKDFNGKPTTVTSKQKAIVFKSELAAEKFLDSLPERLKIYQWYIRPENDNITILPEIKTFGNHSKVTVLEEEGFDICEFFTKVIDVMAELDRYIANMVSNEEITDMKILDVRHYLRDNEHKLNAIQMQRLGYYLQELEKERYKYKSGRLIASMFVNSITALKDKNSVEKIKDVVTSKYHPRVLDDTDIEHIINKKKDVTFSA